MVAALRQFVQNVIVLMLLGTFLQMILPEGNMRRYAQLAVGLIMVLVLLTPLLQLSRIPFDLGVSLSQATISAAWEELQVRGKVWQEQNDQTLLKTYRQSLAEQVQQLVELSGEMKLLSCQIELVEERQADDFGRILSLEVQVSRQQEWVQPVTAVWPVQVGDAKGVQRTGPSANLASDAALVQSVLANHFVLDAEQVSVTIK
ncbi:MAG: stage III sporulation protein AF [Bacillota bacterium]